MRRAPAAWRIAGTSERLAPAHSLRAAGYVFRSEKPPRTCELDGNYANATEPSGKAHAWLDLRAPVCIPSVVPVRCNLLSSLWNSLCIFHGAVLMRSQTSSDAAAPSRAGVPPVALTSAQLRALCCDWRACHISAASGPPAYYLPLTSTCVASECTTHLFHAWPALAAHAWLRAGPAASAYC